MGAIDFPSNPTDQQVFSSGGVTYIYNASIGAWLTSYVSTPLYTSANTQVLYNDDGQSKGNTGLVFDRRANTLIVNNLVAAGSNIASVINSAFGRANTALQNTDGVVFNGSLKTTGYLGVNQINPQKMLHVGTGGNSNAYVGDVYIYDDGQAHVHSTNTRALYINSAAALKLNAEVAGNIDMVVGGGSVSIGTTSVVSKLSVVGSIAITDSGGAQYLIMGNRDSGGVNRPGIMRSFNGGNFEWGYGNSWSSATGGTLTRLMLLENTGTLTPGTDAGADLGSTSYRWRNIYTADAHFSNEGTDGNSIDGTTGNWTLQEGDENLYLLNNKNGKKYKFVLQEVK